MRVVLSLLVGFVAMLGSGFVWIASMVLGFAMAMFLLLATWCFIGSYFSGHSEILTGLGFLGYAAVCFLAIGLMHYGLAEANAVRVSHSRR